MSYSSRKRKRSQEDVPKEDDKEIQQNLEQLNKQLSLLKNEIVRLKQKDEKKDELINIILEKNKNINESIDKLKKDNKFLKDIVSINQKVIKAHEKTINELKEENGLLSKEIEKLYPIAFSCQLRKLLKKILEYIVKDGFLSSSLTLIGKEVQFILPNDYSSQYFSRSDIMQAFKLLLHIIQFYTLDCDYKIHYVDKNAIFQIYLRKRINVFNNYTEFFKFFNIDKKYEDILIKHIPPYLFYSIDNYTFEEKVSSLISKIK